MILTLKCIFVSPQKTQGCIDKIIFSSVQCHRVNTKSKHIQHNTYKSLKSINLAEIAIFSNRQK